MNRKALVLALFAVVFTTLCVVSYTQKSATWDEPQHVLRGCLGWRGDNRMDPEHPPFLRLWAALPVAFDQNTKLDTSPIDKFMPGDWVGFGQFQYAQHFLYTVNDADRLLYRERFMIVLLGLLLGAMLFSWANEWLGFGPAVAALALYCFEPNIMAHSTLVTTDLGAACFIFGTLYFLWRASRQASVLNAGGAILFFTLAMVSKFTSVLLIPVVVVLLAIDAWRTRAFVRNAGIFAGMLAATWLAMWATYGFRFAPSANPTWFFHFEQGSPFGNHFPVFARLAVWADEHKLLPNACTQGFLLGQIKAQARGSYLFGHFSTTGWWYYFPVAFLIKTPVALLAFMAGGFALAIARWRNEALHILLLPVVFVGISMTQKLNIGLRHILPVYPPMLLLCAVAVAWLLRRGKCVVIAGIVLAMLEFGRAYPSPLAFFNVFGGGPDHGDACLVDSNLDWGQDLKGLKRWMDANDVKHINLCYFGMADAAYYKIDCTHLPGSGFTESNPPPQLPGYVAISATNLRGVYFQPQYRQFYAPFLSMKPVAKIGYSIFVYRVERPWWQ